MLADYLKLVFCTATQDQHVCKDPISLSCGHDAQGNRQSI